MRAHKLRVLYIETLAHPVSGVMRINWHVQRWSIQGSECKNTLVDPGDKREDVFVASNGPIIKENIITLN